MVGRNPVAPFAGAWIEIWVLIRKAKICTVAPFAGAWIEMAGNYSEYKQK